MVETGGLENRFTLTGNGGSNPSPSATDLPERAYDGLYFATGYSRLIEIYPSRAVFLPRHVALLPLRKQRLSCTARVERQVNPTMEDEGCSAR